MRNKIVKKLNDIVLGEDKSYDELMFWVECPAYQDEIVDIKDETSEDSNGINVRHITFCFDGFLDDTVAKDLMEWKNLVDELSEKEVKLWDCKEAYQIASEDIIAKTDFKELYGKNNADVRKQHVKNELSDWYYEIHSLEVSIDWIVRRINFLRSLVRYKIKVLGKGETDDN